MATYTVSVGRWKNRTAEKEVRVRLVREGNRFHHKDEEDINI